MNDDFSALESGADCYAISTPTTIYAYKDGVRSTYLQISGKWLKTEQNSYSNLPDNYVCNSYADITDISSYSYMLPFYHIIGFALGFFVLWAWWFIIRRVFKWRG